MALQLIQMVYQYEFKENNFADGIYLLDENEEYDQLMKDLSKDNYLVVKYYHPQCQHCIELSQNWQGVQEYIEQHPFDQKVVLAESDCSSNTKLCKAAKLGGYPQINIYKNGYKLSTFDDERTVENIYRWINTIIHDEQLQQQIINNNQKENKEEL